MQAVVLTGIRQMEIVEQADPVIARDTDVLLKLERVGVCGSDVHYYETGRIGSQVVKYPYRVGHECAATVIEVGKGVSRVQKGDQVAVDPAMPCYRCDQCLCGRDNTCRHLGFLGTPGQAEGCLCEYIVMPEKSLYVMRGDITLDQAAMSEPLSITVYSVKRSRMAVGAEIAILGAGPIGLCTMVSASAAGAKRIFMTEIIEERRQLAADNGADWAGDPNKQDVVSEIKKRSLLGLDVVFECAGQQATIDQGVELLKPGGTLVLTGIPREDRISMAIDLCRRKELTIVNIRRQTHCVQEALDLIAGGAVNVDFMVTHHFAFAQSKRAFDLVASYQDGVVKAMIEF